MKLHFPVALSVAVLVSSALARGEFPANTAPFVLDQASQSDDGQQNQKNDGQKNQKDDGQLNQVVVKQLDLSKSILTGIALREGKKVEQSFRLDEKVAVRFGNKAATLTDLKPEMKVAVRLSKDKKAVVEIQVLGSNQKDNGQQNQSDSGQQNQYDNGQRNQKDDGQQNQKDDGQKN